MPRPEPAFKIKNSTVPVFVIHITTPDMERLKAELEQRSSQQPGFFTHTPVVLGLAGVADTALVPDFADLIGFLVAHGMRVAGVQGGSEAQRQAATLAGLGLFPDAPGRPAGRHRGTPEPDGSEPGEPVVPAESHPDQDTAPAPAADIPIQPELPGLEPLTGAAESAPPVADEPPAPLLPTSRPTVVVDKPVRAGQRIHAEGADLVVLAIVNAGAELIADGDIHVYAPLRGRALAGARGNEAARIFVQSLEAELVSVAGLFQVFEDGIPVTLAGKPVMIRQAGGRLLLEPLHPRG